MGLQGEAFLVDRAYDGEAALEMAVAGAYDLILLDYMLPKKNGVQVAEGIALAATNPDSDADRRDSDEASAVVGQPV